MGATIIPFLKISLKLNLQICMTLFRHLKKTRKSDLNVIENFITLNQTHLIIFLPCLIGILLIVSIKIPWTWFAL